MNLKTNIFEYGASESGTKKMVDFPTNNEANAWLREGFIVQQQHNIQETNIFDTPVSLLANLDQHKHAEGYVYFDNNRAEVFNDNRTEFEHYKIVINGGSIFAFN